MNKILTNILMAAFILSAMVACVAPTQIVSSWRDPGTTIKNPTSDKIVVAALIYDQAVRRQVEDYMATLYPGVASQSYTVLGGDSLIRNEAATSQKLRDLGY